MSAAFAFISGILFTLGADELGALQRRSPSGAYRKRDRTIGVLLWVVCALFLFVSCFQKVTP